MPSWASLLLPFGSSQPGHEFQRRQETSQSLLGVIAPLGSGRRKGLIASICVASVSLVATFSLLCFLTYRMIFWKKYHRRYIGYNHYIVLVYNLALADAQQCLAFIVSLRWIATDSIPASDGFCFLQGIWLQIGDPMSGMFVLAIAVYTSLHIILNYQIGHRLFVAMVVGLWVFGVLMVIIPIAAVGRWVWFPAIAWCWLTYEHDALRIWTHYFWIFAAQFLTVVLYVALFVHIRRRVVECIALRGRSSKTLRRMNRVARFMVLYPIVYICLTLPLAAGRMADTSGHPPSVTYFCVAGSLMTLSGLCDTVLYALARKNSVLDPEGARVTSNDSNELTSGGSTLDPSTLDPSTLDPSTLDPSTLDDDPVSAARVPSHLSDVTDLNVPNTDVERVA